MTADTGGRSVSGPVAVSEAGSGALARLARCARSFSERSGDERAGLRTGSDRMRRLGIRALNGCRDPGPPWNAGLVPPPCAWMRSALAPMAMVQAERGWLRTGSLVFVGYVSLLGAFGGIRAYESRIRPVAEWSRGPADQSGTHRPRRPPSPDRVPSPRAVSSVG